MTVPLSTALALFAASAAALMLLACVRVALSVLSEEQLGGSAGPDEADEEHEVETVSDGPRTRLALSGGALLATAGLVVAALALAETLWGGAGAIVTGAAAAVAAAAAAVVFGEILPQVFAARRPEAILERFGRTASVATAAMGPILWPLDALSRALVRAVAGRAPAGEVARIDCAEGFRTLLALSLHRGLGESGQELIENVYAFGDATVRELMTPRSDMRTLPASATTEEVLDFIHREQFSRVPIVDEGTGQVLGVLYAKDLIGRSMPLPPLREVARPAYVVPESASAEDVFEKLRLRRVHMAIVVDEYGVAVGAVTMEDLLEELFGEIYDEYDERETLWTAGAEPGTYVVAGSLTVEDFNETTGARLPLDVAETVGGYVFHGFGVVPAEGDVLEDQGWRFEVLKIDGARIAELKVAPLPAEAEGAPEAGAAAS